MDKTYTFIVGWILLLILLLLANRTRIGHVLIYYSLLLMILLILVAEYKQFVPFFNFQTIGETQT